MEKPKIDTRGRGSGPFPNPEERKSIFFTVAFVLCICWALGMLMSPGSFGRLIHFLPGLAAVMFMVGVFEGRRSNVRR